jgi:3-deoxy-manno-octulosonate cytidylyltransferase (CMP-KDO synthetase)
MKIVALIPARLASTRFPEKPLAHILGKPMILWVAELTAKAVGMDNTYIATDSDKISSVVEAAGFRVVMTSPDALTGTDRIAEAAEQIDADIFINVQGDEPMLNPASITKVIEAAKQHPDTVINGYAPIPQSEDPSNVNLPKCAIASNGRLLYMSRAAIPAYKDYHKRQAVYYKQVCIYAFTRAHLQAYVSVSEKAPCEQSEDIEILRFLDLGLAVQMIELPSDTLAVDAPGDVEMVESAMRQVGY